MSEITRTEKFLRACIDGVPCELKPLTRMEKLLAELNDKLAGSPSEVVILPETELAAESVADDSVTFSIATPPNASPEVGKTYAVTLNGVAYDITAIELDGTVLLSHDLASPLFAVVFLPPEAAANIGAYVVVEASPTVGNSITLSIVQTEGAASGGEDADYIITVDANMTTTQKWAEVAAAYKAGSHVRLVMKMAITSEGIVNNYEYLLIGHSTSAGALTMLLYYMPGILLNNPVRYTVTAADDGGIKITEASGD